jgi:hypothetical protein
MLKKKISNRDDMIEESNEWKVVQKKERSKKRTDFNIGRGKLRISKDEMTLISKINHRKCKRIEVYKRLKVNIEMLKLDELSKTHMARALKHNIELRGYIDSQEEYLKVIKMNKQLMSFAENKLEKDLRISRRGVQRVVI